MDHHASVLERESRSFDHVLEMEELFVRKLCSYWHLQIFRLPVAACCEHASLPNSDIAGCLGFQGKLQTSCLSSAVVWQP
jgi:hypothetical protein